MLQAQPATTVVVGDEYRFQPQVTNAAGANVTFEIVNRPSWSTFDSATGLLSGTPSVANLGVHGDIDITARAGSRSGSTGSFAIQVLANAGAPGTPPPEDPATQATLAWDAPATFVDGAPLGDSIAVFRVYQGRDPSSLAHVASVDPQAGNRYVIRGLTSGVHYFAVSVVTNVGHESELTETKSKTVP